MSWVELSWVDDTKARVKSKLKLWRNSLESKGFKLNRTMIEYKTCNFSIIRNKDVCRVIIEDHEVLKNNLKYLELIIHKEIEI